MDSFLNIPVRDVRVHVEEPFWNVPGKSRGHWDHSQAPHPPQNLVLESHREIVPLLREGPSPPINVPHAAPGQEGRPREVGVQRLLGHVELGGSL